MPPKRPSGESCCCSTRSGDFNVRRLWAAIVGRPPYGQVFPCGALLDRASRRLVLHLLSSWGPPRAYLFAGKPLSLSSLNLAEVALAKGQLTKKSEGESP